MDRRKRKRKRRTRETAAALESRPGPRPVPSSLGNLRDARHRRKRRREENQLPDQQTTWSKLFNNLILHGYLFVVTFPFGMQTSEPDV